MPNLFLEIRDPGQKGGTSPPPLSETEALSLLTEAEFTASKLIPWGSNYSFAVVLAGADGREQLAIYKPRSGEAPLYDFADGTLYRREVAAYLLSALLGWGIVPPTVAREGPHGIGSVQLYIEPMEETADWEPNRFWGRCDTAIERLVLFDHIANNADRKLSHCLRDGEGRIWGIDHGLTFSEMPKLRTVLWQFVGSPLNPGLRDDLVRLSDRSSEVRATIRPFLSKSELNALFARVDRFAESGQYPQLNPRRNIPYGWW